MRYVELNPKRAGIVSHPRDYRWSSYTAHANGDPNPVVTFHPLYLALGADPSERQRCWRGHCGEDVAGEELQLVRNAVAAGGALGAIRVPDEPSADSLQA
jgi:putative transposase